MKNYYFTSDVHLGLSYRGSDPRVRERLFVKWLREIEGDCEKLFLVGDVFDFWFEWQHVVPKGFTRLFGQLALMSDVGIEIHFFAGNHDMWLRDYFQRELGLIVHEQGEEFEVNGTRFYVAHGDTQGQELSNDDIWGRRLSKLFRSRTARWCFSNLLHPDLAMTFGLGWSNSSRHSREAVGHGFGGNGERIVRFAKHYLETRPGVRYFICGHFHTPVVFDLGGAFVSGVSSGTTSTSGTSDNHSKLCVLGEWITDPRYARLDVERGVLELLPYSAR